MLKSSYFNEFKFSNGILADLPQEPDKTTLRAWQSDSIQLPRGATHYGFVYSGSTVVRYGQVSLNLIPGMYFCVPGEGFVTGEGQGIILSKADFTGVFQVGGPVEEWGRLRYIDGCTDSLLIPPVLLGDPCFNALFFPPGINQTQHTHPSVRAGLVYRGRGWCVTPDGETELAPGKVFIIPTEGLHSFRTEDDSMTVIAYHPDSDFGPTHEDHPMLNRTVVDGVSASQLADIQTTVEQTFQSPPSPQLNR